MSDVGGGLIPCPGPPPHSPTEPFLSSARFVPRRCCQSISHTSVLLSLGKPGRRSGHLVAEDEKSIDADQSNDDDRGHLNNHIHIYIYIYSYTICIYMWVYIYVCIGESCLKRAP